MAKVEAEYARKVIGQNRGIGILYAIRDSSFYFSGMAGAHESPQSAALETRSGHVAKFQDFFADVYEHHLSSRHLEKYKEKGVTDMMLPVFEAIFEGEDNGLLKDWMGQVDSHVRSYSIDNLAKIDAEAKKGGVVKKDIVIVGGGPLTSLAVSVLSPYYNVCVITDQNTVGKPWRNRPIYTNSSVAPEPNDEPRLPLQKGTTTPVISSLPGVNIDTDILLGADVKIVACDDRTSRYYVSGPRLGDLVATNIVLNTSDFIVNQKIELSDVKLNQDGTKRLTLKDTRTGKTRSLDASTVIFLTGPGKETCKFEDKPSQRAYRNAQRQVDKSIRQARAEIRNLKRTIKHYKDKGLDTDALLYEMRLISVTIPVPHILTLSSVEKIFEFWYEDLDADPRRYPFEDVMKRNRAIGFIGNGDSSRTLKELVDGKGPLRAYPNGQRIFENTSAVIYNETAESGAEYDRKNRRRYKGIYNFRTFNIKGKAVECFTEKNGQGKEEVAVKAEDGYYSIFDYVFVATGYERDDPGTHYPAYFSLQDLYDSESNVTGIGDAERGLIIGGSAANLPFAFLPNGLRNIIKTLEIPENTISLWVNALLLERFLWRLVAKEYKKDEESKPRYKREKMVI